MNSGPQEILRQALTELSAGRAANAVALLAPHVEEPKADAGLLRLAGLLAHRRGELLQAAHLFQRVLEQSSGDVDTRYNLGVTYQQLARFDEAITCFQAVLGSRPTHAGAALNLSQSLISARRFDEARPALSRAIELSPDEARLHASLAALLSAERDPELLEDAGKAASRALELNPEHAGAWDTLGIVLMKQERAPQAIAAGEKALTLQPGKPAFAIHLADHLYRAGHVAKAEQVLRDAIRRCPEVAELERQLGISRLRAGDAQEALACLERCLRVMPQDQRALAHKAVALRALGRNEDADVLLSMGRFMHAVRPADLAPYRNLADFNRAFAEDIREHPSLQFEPVGLAARGGSLSGELLDAPTESIRVFERNLRSAIEALRAGLTPDPSHPFLSAIPDRYKLNTWATLVPSHGEISSHIHEGSWLSGAYYVGLPSAMDEDDSRRAGWIEFGRPSADLPQIPEDSLHWVRPEEGLLLLFPSYWFHRTLPFEGAGERISVSFDVEEVA